MLSEDTLAHDAAEQLRKAGFPFVQSGVRIPGVGRHRSVPVDVIAWDVAADGELRRSVLVETKKGFSEQLTRGGLDVIAGVLHQLSGYASALGTMQNFVFDETGWHRVAETFDQVQRVDCPAPALLKRGAKVRLPDDLVSQVVMTEAWRRADAARSQSVMLSPVDVADQILADIENGAIQYELTQITRTKTGRQAIVRALLADVFPRFADCHHGQFLTPWPLCVAMALLARPASKQTILDPFCGSGGCLWAVGTTCPDASLRGLEINRTTASLAERLAQFAGFDANIQVADTFAVADDIDPVDIVVSNLPFNMRLREEAKLHAGGMTADSDFIVLDRVPHWLRAGGRAVLLVPPKVLFGGGVGERVRGFLQENIRVTAIINLPAGLLPATKIPIVVLVLDKTAPGPTLAARLGDDWQEQLSPSGGFFKAFLKHTEHSASE